MGTISRIAALAALALTQAFAAESYIIVDCQTGHVLESQKQDEKLPVASLTKVATAVVALDWAQVNNSNLSAIVEISPRALTAGGMNPVGFQAGDRLSLRDLIYCALLASDNVAATALAEAVGERLPNTSGLDPA